MTNSKPDKPRKAAEALLCDMDDRDGYSLDGVDKGDLERWEQAWADIIRRELQWEKVERLCKVLNGMPDGIWCELKQLAREIGGDNE